MTLKSPLFSLDNRRNTQDITIGREYSLNSTQRSPVLNPVFPSLSNHTTKAPLRMRPRKKIKHHEYIADSISSPCTITNSEGGSLSLLRINGKTTHTKNPTSEKKRTSNKYWILQSLKNNRNNPNKLCTIPSTEKENSFLHLEKENNEQFVAFHPISVQNNNKKFISKLTKNLDQKNTSFFNTKIDKSLLEFQNEKDLNSPRKRREILNYILKQNEEKLRKTSFYLNNWKKNDI